MIKPFIICMSGLVMSLMCMATPTIQKNGDFIPIAIEEPVNPSQGHPHAPARRLFDAYVDTELSAVIITASSDLGEVDAYICPPVIVYHYPSSIYFCRYLADYSVS